MKINVKTTKLDKSTNNVKGLCSVTFGDSFVVKNISVVESKKGELFVSMPNFKSKTVDAEGNPIFKDIAFPITKEFREALYKQVLASYESSEVKEFNWE